MNTTYLLDIGLLQGFPEQPVLPASKQKYNKFKYRALTLIVNDRLFIILYLKFKPYNLLKFTTFSVKYRARERLPSTAPTRRSTTDHSYAFLNFYRYTTN